MGEERGKRELAALWAGWWLWLSALWLLVVGTLDLAEVLVGVLAAAVAAVAATSVLAPGVERFRPARAGCCARFGAGKGRGRPAALPAPVRAAQDTTVTPRGTTS